MQHNNNNARMPPASPSWISLRNNRSTSMPQIRRSRHSRDGSSGGGRLKLWAQSILSGVGVTPSPEKKRKPTTSLGERRRSLIVAEGKRHFQVPPPYGSLSFASSSQNNKVECPPTTHDAIPANVRVGIVLGHLEEHLPKYCQLLQEPTFANCQEACQILARAIARSMPSSTGGNPHTSNSNNNSNNNNNNNSNGSPHSVSSHKSTNTPSPSRSPLRSLFGGGRESSSYSSSPQPTHTRNLVMDSALALEREWERYSLPLYVFAASEAMYANLHHAQQERKNTAYLAGSHRHVLEGLYRWLMDDLTLVKETLCDSVMATTTTTTGSSNNTGKNGPSGGGGSPNSHRRKFLQETAQKIAPILLLLASMAKHRYRLIQYQATLWDNNNKKQFGLLADAMEDLGKSWTKEWNTNNNNTSAAAGAGATRSRPAVANNPLVESVSKELAIWKHLLETANYLEKCRFMESILSSRKTKVRLNPTSQLKMQQWFVSTLQQMIASSYLYFDRVNTFAKPLYGFQNAAFCDTENTNKSRMGGSPHALEDKVLDFLHKQQKSGTADVAVTIVHDAVQTSNLHMERGFTLAKSSTAAAEDESKYNELETARLHWPAVYVRTTKNHGEAQVGGVSLLGGNKRRKHASEDSGSTSFSDHYKRWGSKDASTASSNPHNNNKSLQEANEAAIQRNTLEYAPDHGSASWPHTEWESIVGLITGSGDLPSTARLVSNREASAVTEEHGLFFKFLNHPSTPALLSASQTDKEAAQMECVVRRANNGRSAFWMAELSEFSWLVVLTKAEEESRWHRRRGSRFDDAEEFVQHLVSNLRVENCFQTLPTEDLQEFPFEPDLSRGIEIVTDWNEKSAEDFLLSVKYAFGLSTKKSKGDPHHNKNNNIYNRRFRIGNSPSVPPPKPQVTMDSSALEFFWGADLCRMKRNGTIIMPRFENHEESF